MKAATIPHIGATGDTVLKMRGRSAEFAVAPPTLLGEDNEGFLIAWHYEDCDVILHRRKGGYRVKEVQLVKQV